VFLNFCVFPFLNLQLQTPGRRVALAMVALHSFALPTATHATHPNSFVFIFRIFKGILPQKKLYRTNLVPWDLEETRDRTSKQPAMRPPGNPHGPRGPREQTLRPKFSILGGFFGPSDRNEFLPHPITLQNMRFGDKIFFVFGSL